MRVEAIVNIVMYPLKNVTSQSCVIEDVETLQLTYRTSQVNRVSSLGLIKRGKQQTSAIYMMSHQRDNRPEGDWSDW